MTDNNSSGNDQSRRTFLKTAAVAGAALTVEALSPALYAAGSDAIKVGLVGCGGRGTGAAENVLQRRQGRQDRGPGRRLQEAPSRAAAAPWSGIAKKDEVKSCGNSVDLPEERCFVGLDAYKKVIDNPEVNYVILATPPGFRPLHIEAAVAAGKNMFTEKPVGTDGPGIKKVLDAYDVAQEEGAADRRRHPAPPPGRLHRDDQADPRRRHRRRHPAARATGTAAASGSTTATA